MTYEIRLELVPEGRTIHEVLDEKNAAYDPDGDDLLQPLELGEDARAVWERITRRVAEEVGPVTVEDHPAQLQLWRRGAAGTFWLTYYGDSADIEIPYRHPGENAVPIMAEAYRTAVIVAEETGMTAHDFEVGQAVIDGDLTKAAARLGGIARWVHHNLS